MQQAPLLYRQAPSLAKTLCLLRGFQPLRKKQTIGKSVAPLPARNSLLEPLWLRERIILTMDLVPQMEQTILETYAALSEQKPTILTMDLELQTVSMILTADSRLQSDRTIPTTDLPLQRLLLRERTIPKTGSALQALLDLSPMG